MADIVSTKILSENVREVVYQFNYQYIDTGNESAVQKVDASTLAVASNGDSCTGLRIQDVTFNVSGMTVQILKDGDGQDPMMLNLTEDLSGYFDISKEITVVNLLDIKELDIFLYYNVFQTFFNYLNFLIL